MDKLVTRTHIMPLRLIRSYSNLPRITVPHRVAQKIEKIKRTKQKPHFQRRQRGPVMISCNRPEFNHHRGQTYSDFSPKHLASGGWKHYKSKGDHLTIHSQQGNPSLVLDNDYASSFNETGLSEKLCNALSAVGFEKPTNIQALTIPEMLAGNNVLCAAETGSGKTLAFLLPILERLYRLHECGAEHERPNEPAAVILTPLRELADQIHAVIQLFAQDLPFISSQSVCGGKGTQKLIKDPSVANIDILVSTPGVFSKLLTNRVFQMSRLNHFVIDEADTLFDDSFNELTVRIIRKMKIQSEHISMEDSEGENVGTQCALVAATMPKDLEKILGDVLPLDSLSRIETPFLHKLLPHVPQKFVRISGPSKPESLLSHIKKNPNVPTLVFCNKSSTAGFVHLMLEENGVDNVLYHAQMSQEMREGRFNQFQNGHTKVLVCTDIASRGLDTIRAQHVINYEFPHFMSDYIHRVGRVGRVGNDSKGFALSFVTYKWDVDLLWKIETSARRMTELHNVNANIKRKLTGIVERKYMPAGNLGFKF